MRKPRILTVAPVALVSLMTFGGTAALAVPAQADATPASSGNAAPTAPARTAQPSPHHAATATSNPTPTPNILTRTTQLVAGAPKACTSDDTFGCFRYSQTKSIADYSVRNVQRAISTLYPRLPQPSKIWYIPQGKTYRWCSQTMTDTTFAYCFLDSSIALGQRPLWEFYHRAGDAAPLVGVAHEYAHHIQHARRVPRPRTARQSINFENQADCLAGAIVRQLRREAIFTHQDLQDVNELIPLIASAEGLDRDHGTSAERVGAIYRGMRFGARSCNRYVPGSQVG